jgi:hypothetical protein
MATWEAGVYTCKFCNEKITKEFFRNDTPHICRTCFNKRENEKQIRYYNKQVAAGVKKCCKICKEIKPVTEFQRGFLTCRKCVSVTRSLAHLNKLALQDLTYIKMKDKRETQSDKLLGDNILEEKKQNLYDLLDVFNYNIDPYIYSKTLDKENFNMELITTTLTNLENLLQMMEDGRNGQQ